mmetsp:Transcript_35376/g.80964  ORF Transcript_35376/g.80964 Transcript_35376/m.80964 type:complete len:272 (-) Transcript_35376:4-819(-)
MFSCSKAPALEFGNAPSSFNAHANETGNDRPSSIEESLCAYFTRSSACATPPLVRKNFSHPASETSPLTALLGGNLLSALSAPQRNVPGDSPMGTTGSAIARCRGCRMAWYSKSSSHLLSCTLTPSFCSSDSANCRAFPAASLSSKLARAPPSRKDASGMLGCNFFAPSASLTAFCNTRLSAATSPMARPKWMKHNERLARSPASSCKSSVPGLFRFPSSVMQAEYLRASSYQSMPSSVAAEDHDGLLTGIAVTMPCFFSKMAASSAGVSG